MTSHRGMGFGSSDRPADDAARAVVAPLLDDLRAELLVLPREEVVADHLEMMAFEQQVLATPQLARRTRSSLARPRRTAFVVACVCATVASCGLSAAGALPQPLQQITDSIARTLGVPKPHESPSLTHKGAARTTPATAETPRVAPATTPATAKVPSATRSTHPTQPASHPVTVPSHPAVQKVPKQPAPYTPARPTTPSKRRITPRQPGPPPSNHSDNTPPGYPKAWRKLAIQAATAQLRACANANALTQNGCPKEATAAGANGQAQSVHWTLLNDPQADAVAVAQTKRTLVNGKTVPSTTVTVYEPFRMDASYTEAATGSRSYLAYSAGIAQATMTWNGSSFRDASFATGSAAGHLLPGVTVSSFSRPAVPDSSILGAVLAGFDDCTAITQPGTNPTPNCDPTTTVTWTLVGDPTQGAVVTFDPQQGLFRVTGTFTMTSSTAGAPLTGHYTAGAFFDGQHVYVLSIAALP